MTTEVPHGDLSRAVAANDLESVKQLLQEGANIDENIDSGDEHITPLFIAIIKGHESMGRFLLSKGASRKPTYRGYRALDYAYQIFPEDSALIRVLEQKVSEP